MATTNPFDLLGDDDSEDPSQFIAAQQQKIAAAPKKSPAAQVQAKSAVLSQTQQNKASQMPSKPPPPAQAVRDAKAETGRGGERGGGRGYGRGRGGNGYNRVSANNENSFSNSAAPAVQGAPEEGEARRPYERHNGPRGPPRGGQRGGFNSGEDANGERPRRTFERRSGTGRGSELKREGAGRGNWGMETDELARATEEVVNETADEKPVVEEGAADDSNDTPVNEAEEKEPENKEMTLEEYEKVLEEKRKALQALKTEERKVDTKAFEAMQQLSNKKDNNDVFIKLSSDKDRKKDFAEKEEKAKKPVVINEFFTEGYGSGGRRAGRGRGSRGEGIRGEGSRGGGRGSRGEGSSTRGERYTGNYVGNVPAPSIEDPGQFPALGGK